MNEEKGKIGTIGWIDLTSTNAEKVRDFYQQVVGWTASPVSMGDYDDYSMIPPHGDHPVAGICHARGINADLPASWLIYIEVEDLDISIKHCKAGGGSVISGPHQQGESGRYCVIKDPAGAVAALYCPK